MKPKPSISIPFEPSRLLPRSNPNSPCRAGPSGLFAINASAAAIRAFGFAVRAGAPRRNHASSFFAAFLRTCSAVAEFSSRSARAAKYAAYPDPAFSPAGICRYACPRSISNTRLVTRSSTCRSCVTIASPPGKRASVSSRNPIASRSKWFVGSSRMRQSHSPASSRANATRFN